MLPLVGIVGRIETVGAEIAVLPPGLQVEEPGPPAVVGRPYECVVVGEIGIVPVAVAAAVRSRAEHREASRTHRARKIPGVTRVTALTDPANAASQRVLLKNGFAFEKTIHVEEDDSDADVYVLKL